jgi:FkbM family methyltransferase
VPFVRELRRGQRQFRRFPPDSFHSILDIGACEGEFTDLARAYFQSETHWLVEADPELAKKLEVKYRGIPGCEVIQAAITDHTGEATLRVNEHRPSSSVLPIGVRTGEVFGKSMREVREVNVPALTLDELFAEQKIEAVDLMKVDIQGAEKLMIRGGVKALTKVRTIYIEALFEECYQGCALFGELDPMLRQQGFKLRDLEDFRRGADGSLAYGNAIYFRPGK